MARLSARRTKCMYTNRPREEFTNVGKPPGGYLGALFPLSFLPPPLLVVAEGNLIPLRRRRGLDKYSNLNRGLQKERFKSGAREEKRAYLPRARVQSEEGHCPAACWPSCRGGVVFCRRVPWDKSRPDGQFGVEWPGSDGEQVPQGRRDDTPRGHMRTRPPRGAGLAPPGSTTWTRAPFLPDSRSLSLSPFFPVDRSLYWERGRRKGGGVRWLGERDRRGRRLRAHPRGQKEDECGFFRTGVRPSSAILAPLSLSLHLFILRSLLRANQKMQGQSSDGSQEFRNALRFCLYYIDLPLLFLFFFPSFSCVLFNAE